jgi:excisionase family DNA binding protein
MNEADVAIAFGISQAKQRGAEEVAPDDILLGGLWSISKFGIVSLGPWTIDLEALGVDWLYQPEGPKPKVAYSEGAVRIFDRATQIAKSARAPVEVVHLLAAYALEEEGLMGELKRAHNITSTSWRTAIAQISAPHPNGGSPTPTPEKKEYLTPEQAAEALGIHVQTMRAYIRSGRLPAFRVAGERAIRVLRTDLEKVLEPLGVEKPGGETN